MDQEKIGKFIASCRKENGYTQAQLAEKLDITDRAVSKWERGKSLPDASIMLGLCEILNINVNELLTGQRLNSENYKIKAEENLLLMQKMEEKNNAKIIHLYQNVSWLLLILFITCILVASYLISLEYVWTGNLVIGISIVCIFLFCFYGIHIEQSTGYYRCQKCQETFVPTYRETLFAPHKGLSRYLRCPNCHRLSYCKKVYTKL